MKMTPEMTVLLQQAHKGGYAVGSFSPRYTPLIQPIIEAAIREHSPVIVQISEKEILRHQIDLPAFVQTYNEVKTKLKPTVPVFLHLDHTKDLAILKQAMELGFDSVMIDASEHPFEKNIQITAEVVSLAHKQAIGVEAELGRIGTTDFVETDKDEEQYTVPEEARQFCLATQVDFLAVSVGTAHGIYTVREPRIDLERIAAINILTDVPLVLHGGSGVPSAMVNSAVSMAGGGVSKVNIATDLEQAMLKVLGKTDHMTDAQLATYSQAELDSALVAVRDLVADKMRNYVLSANRA